MLKKIVFAALTGACLLPLAAYAQGDGTKSGKLSAPRVVKKISVKNSGSCQLKSLNLAPVSVPKNMKKGNKSFELSLRCSMERGATGNDLRVLYTKGEFIDPDGQHYKIDSASFELEINDKGTSIVFALLADIHENIDVAKLKYVLDGQALLLAK
jgi:hypothetical protein